jgi:hypothetical protein
MTLHDASSLIDCEQECKLVSPSFNHLNPLYTPPMTAYHSFLHPAVVPHYLVSIIEKYKGYHLGCQIISFLILSFDDHEE